MSARQSPDARESQHGVATESGCRGWTECFVDSISTLLLSIQERARRLPLRKDSTVPRFAFRPPVNCEGSPFLLDCTVPD